MKYSGLERKKLRDEIREVRRGWNGDEVNKEGRG